MVDKQIALEESFLVNAQAKYDTARVRMSSAGLFHSSSEGAILKKLSIEMISVSLDTYMNQTLRGHGAKVQQFIRDSFSGRADELALTIIEILLNRVGSNKTQLTANTVVVTNQVLNLLSVEDFKKNEPKFYSYLEYEYKSRGIGYITSRKLKLADKTGNKQVKSSTFKASVGSVLIDCVINSGANVFRVASYRPTKGKNVERHIVLTEDAFEIISKVRGRGILSSITYKPLLVKPIPWDNLLGNGGYLTPNHLSFIKLKQAPKLTAYIEGLDVDLTRLYSVVNGISSTKWEINKEILEVMEYIVDNNLRNPEFPDTNPQLYGGIPYMESINIYDMVPKEKFGEVNEFGTHVRLEDYKEWFTAKEVQLKKLEALKSKRILFVLSMDIAREYSQYNEFYFSYNLDFRGRLYPIQTLFTPQTTGAIKSLLQFSTKEYLTEDGVYWLKVHTANTYGLDKSSFSDRVKWVDDNLDAVLRYANDPLSHLKEWNVAEDALMFLAGCKALRDHYEGKPVGLPVSLDATCSGLQIYSGLLKDKQGGSVVNVINGDSEKPADVYTDVAMQVEKYLEKGEYASRYTFTTKDGEAKACSTITEANDLQGNVTRKLTKRNVMTIPYSVTRRGMYDQVRDILNEMEDNNKTFWKGDKWIVAKLLVDLNAKAISEIVKGATIGQEFIKQVVHDVYQDNDDKPLVWKTPFFSFPVVQWKEKMKQKRVKTVLGNLSLRIPTDKINKQQQNNGIAPNLIHSLDATLMYLTVEKLLAQGVGDYMLIHDSFGVSPNNVSKLNLAVRESFVELFQGNPLEDWVSQIDSTRVAEVGDIMLNDLDLEEVKESRYIFS